MKRSNNKIVIYIVTLIVILLIIGTAIYWYFENNKENPETVLKQYFSNVNEAEYEKMYEMLDEQSKQNITKEDFIARNKNIYQGIDMTNIELQINQIQKEGKKVNISYNTKMNASGGEIEFENKVDLIKSRDKTYKIVWNSNIIFPELNENDKVKVSTSKAERGKIIDRNGRELATNGKASSIGIVPGKLGENKDEDIVKIAELLNLTEDIINNKLGASWVKEDSFVPIKTVSIDETELKEKLLQIQGIKITSVNSRIYPLGEAASHLTGYVQTITKEELEKNSGYSASSLIGKARFRKTI